MEEKLEKMQNIYKRTDRALLWLLTGELGYFILLIILGIVTAIIALLDLSPYGIYLFTGSVLNWAIILPYSIALIGNVAGGFSGALLYTITKQEGYPGTGHLLNWIFLMSTGWVFLLAVVVIIPSSAGGY